MTLMRSRALRSVVAVTATAAITLITAGVAHAEPDATTLANRTSAVVAAASPDDVTVVAPGTKGGALVATGDAVATTLPADGDAPVTLDSTTTAGTSPVTISLPVEVDGAAATVANDGTTVYQGRDHTDVAVQALESGVRIQTILDDRRAPTRFEYTVGDNVTPVLEPDGSINLVVKSSNVGGAESVTVTGTIAAPWAVDANGKDVPTRWVVQGNDIIQVVEHRSARYAYPIVADPKVSWGWAMYINYNKAETAAIKDMAPGGAAATALCTALGALGGPAAAVVVGGACAIVVWQMIYGAKVAWNYSPHRCLQIVVNGPVTNWQYHASSQSKYCN